MASEFLDGVPINLVPGIMARFTMHYFFGRLGVSAPGLCLPTGGGGDDFVDPPTQDFENFTGGKK